MTRRTAEYSWGAADRQKYLDLMEKYPASDTYIEENELRNYSINHGDHNWLISQLIDEPFNYSANNRVADSLKFTGNQYLESASDATGLSQETVKTDTLVGIVVGATVATAGEDVPVTTALGELEGELSGPGKQAVINTIRFFEETPPDNGEAAPVEKSSRDWFNYW